MALWRFICVQKRSLFYQEDHLISRISYSRDKYFRFRSNVKEHLTFKCGVCASFDIVSLVTLTWRKERIQIPFFVFAFLRSCGKAMFTVVSLCPLGWGPCTRPQPPLRTGLAPFPFCTPRPLPRTSSNLFTLKHGLSASGQMAFNRNAFLSEMQTQTVTLSLNGP